MIRVDIESTKVTQHNYSANQHRKAGTIYKQDCWFHLFNRDGTPAKFPLAGEIVIEGEDKPYPPGSYTLDPSSLYLNRFRSLDLSVKLRPLAQSVKQAA